MNIWQNVVRESKMIIHLCLRSFPSVIVLASWGLCPWRSRDTSFFCWKLHCNWSMKSWCCAPSCQAGTYNEIINQSVRNHLLTLLCCLLTRPHYLVDNLVLTNMVLVEWLPCSLSSFAYIKSLAFYSILNSSACWFDAFLIQELLNQVKNILKFTQHFLPNSLLFSQISVVICWKQLFLPGTFLFP